MYKRVENSWKMFSMSGIETKNKKLAFSQNSEKIL